MARDDSAFAPYRFENTAREVVVPVERSRRVVSVKPRNSFLFLQGVSSPFFSRLVQALRTEGQLVKSVNFNMGDLLYGSGARVFYSARPEQLMNFYSDCFKSDHITDVVLFGDCRPVHQPAVELAKSLGIRVHVFEEGYFRPYWITLERNGVNNHSLLPRDPQSVSYTHLTLPTICSV